jgi:hypothetical protein
MAAVREIIEVLDYRLARGAGAERSGLRRGVLSGRGDIGAQGAASN